MVHPSRTMPNVCALRLGRSEGPKLRLTGATGVTRRSRAMTDDTNAVNIRRVPRIAPPPWGAGFCGLV